MEITPELRRILSPLESRVMDGCEYGKSIRDLAQELGCKPKSVINAYNRIRRKIKSIQV